MKNKKNKYRNYNIYHLITINQQLRLTDTYPQTQWVGRDPPTYTHTHHRICIEQNYTEKCRRVHPCQQILTVHAAERDTKRGFAVIAFPFSFSGPDELWRWLWSDMNPWWWWWSHKEFKSRYGTMGDDLK